MHISRRSFLESAAGPAVGACLIAPANAHAAQAASEPAPARAGAPAVSVPIRVKPHHFVDIITSFAAGLKVPRAHPYGHGVHTVTERVVRDRDTMLEIELGADDICAPCRHNVGGRCDDTIDTSYRPAAPRSKQEWNLRIDRRWCERLQLAQGDRLTARQFCERVRDRAGDITDIYREVPAERTAERARRLRAGVARFLE